LQSEGTFFEATFLKEKIVLKFPRRRTCQGTTNCWSKIT